MDSTVSITEEELRELANRNDLIALHTRTASLLESEKNLFVRHLIESKGLDPDKKYSIDPETRELSEVT